MKSFDLLILSETCKSFTDELSCDMLKKSANQKGKLFLKADGTSPKSGILCEAMDSVAFMLMKIPPRFRDSNPVENMFQLIG